MVNDANDGGDRSVVAIGGFPQGIAQYLGPKYGYRAEEAESYDARVLGVLGMLSKRLHDQRTLGSQFYLGDTLSAVDIYSATFMSLCKPLPPEQCPMPDAMRAAFEATDPATEAAIDPILLAHRDFVYGKYLELPLSL